MNDDIFAFVFVGFCGVAIGLAMRDVIPDDFQCTKSDIVDGVAECVKYEKKVKE